MTTQAKTNGKFFTTYKMVLMAILSAMAIVLYSPPLQITLVAFYKLDFSNFVILLGGFAMGPIEAMIMLALKDIVSLLWSGTMGIGELADFIMSAALILPATVIYHRNKNRKNAIIGMVIGTLCMVVAGVLMNKYVLLPFYMTAFNMDMNGILSFAKVSGVDTEWKLLLLVTGPFNLVKGVVLSVVTALIYKPLSPILHGKIR